MTVLCTAPLLVGSPLPVAAQVGPMHCISTLEAPLLGSAEGASASTRPPAPVEVTRCTPVETVPQLLERRAYTWTVPFARGVDILHQATDLLGIAMGGRDGSRVMGLGFQDQALIWDGSAIRNSVAALMQMQSEPMPLRTADLAPVFHTSLGSSQQLAPAAPDGGGGSAAYSTASTAASRWRESIRGMW